MEKEAIVDYYDQCEVDYRLFWDLEHSHAMHFGYWDKETRTLRQALKRENEILAQMADVQKGDLVLDAGCGVGGSSIYLAQTYGCHVKGITLSAKQAAKASENAKKAGVGSLVSFEVQDYTKTYFSPHSFDVVWGMESICHAKNKKAFIQEAARLLKPGGRLIVADGFTNQTPLNSKEKRQMDGWLNGWGVSELESVQAFNRYLQEENLISIQFHDITVNVLPSSRRLYRLAWSAHALFKIGEWMGLRTKRQTENLFGAKWQYSTLKKGLWMYGIFFAKTPSN